MHNDSALVVSVHESADRLHKTRQSLGIMVGDETYAQVERHTTG